MNFVPSLEYSKEFIATIKHFLKSDENVNFSDYVCLVNKYQDLLVNLPFVKEVAICNNLSFGLTGKNSDVDLFVILDKRRFFIGHFLMLFILHILNIRVYKNRVARKFCLSFFVSDDKDSLNLTKFTIHDDIYFKHWFTSLIFLKNNFSLQTDLISLNKDLLLFNCKEFRNLNNKKKYSYTIIFKFIEKFFSYKICDFFEYILKNIQIKHYEKYYLTLNRKGYDISNIVIENGTLKFHLNDIREKFRDYYFSLFK